MPISFHRNVLTEILFWNHTLNLGLGCWLLGWAGRGWAGLWGGWAGAGGGGAGRSALWAGWLGLLGWMAGAGRARLLKAGLGCETEIGSFENGQVVSRPKK